MTGWLLDTNVISELRRPRPNAKVVGFVASKPLDLLFVSIVTFAEIRFGIEQVADVSRRAALNDWLTHKVRPMFEERALPVSEDVMFKWRLLVEDGRQTGHTFSFTLRGQFTKLWVTGLRGQFTRVTGTVY